MNAYWRIIHDGIVYLFDDDMAAYLFMLTADVDEATFIIQC